MDDPPTFSTLERYHTYEIFMNGKFRKKPFTGPPVINAIFMSYEDENIARMFIVKAKNIKNIHENNIYEFNISDFRNTQIVDISTDYSINKLRGQHKLSVSRRNSTTMRKIGALIPDLDDLKSFGGKKSKRKSRKR